MLVLLTLLPILIGPVITVLVVIYVLRLVARAKRGEPMFKAPTKSTFRGVAFTVALGVSLFLGFVGAAVAGALLPRTVMFAADMACPGGMKHDSFNYSYKPGQRGTAQVFTCELPGQAPRDITGVTFVYAGLSFSAAALLLLLVFWSIVSPLLGRLFNRDSDAWTTTFAGGPTGSGPGGAINDIITSALASARTRTVSESASVYVNGQRVNLDPEGESAVRQGVADAFAAVPHAQDHQRNLGDRLKELEELYRTGTINRDEYEAARARMLAEL